MNMRDAFKEGCDTLEMYIAEGGNISWQDNQWWVFEHNGEGVVGGDSIYELILNLDSMRNYHRMNNTLDEVERHYDTL